MGFALRWILLRASLTVATVEEHDQFAMLVFSDGSAMLATDELHFGVLVTADGSIRAERLRRLSLLQRTFDALPSR